MRLVRKRLTLGLDQINYEMLDKFPMDHKVYPLTLYNKIFEKEVFPES